MFEKFIVNNQNHFNWKFLDNSNSPKKDLINFPNFEVAYYQLIKELIALLKCKIDIICEKPPDKIYVDGGFSDNDIFLALLKNQFPKQIIKSDSKSNACALGASMVLNKTG